jgi:hypothetical protein
MNRQYRESLSKSQLPISTFKPVNNLKRRNCVPPIKSATIQYD